MEPFQSKLEIQLLKSDYFYDCDKKNLAKRILQSPIVHIDYFACSRKPEVKDIITLLQEQDNVASLA